MRRGGGRGGTNDDNPLDDVDDAACTVSIESDDEVNRQPYEAGYRFSLGGKNAACMRRWKDFNRRDPCHLANNESKWAGFVSCF
jgi:hypothetical protein